VKSKNTLVVFLFFVINVCFSQAVAEKVIYGNISVDSTVVDGVNIVNSFTNNAAVSDENGRFKLVVKEGDVLIFSAVNLETLHKKISKQDLMMAIVNIQMIVKKVILKDVIINEYSQITAEKMGIVPHGIKKYTPAQRKLKTAGDFKPSHLFRLLGGALALDPIINKISGRTKNLKKQLKVEEKETCLLLLDAMFETSYFVDKLKVPSDYVQGFRYFIVENERFVVLLKSKNKTNAEFAMTDLATQYNEIIASEK
jgi:hypothetical protein